MEGIEENSSDQFNLRQHALVTQSRAVVPGGKTQVCLVGRGRAAFLYCVHQSLFSLGKEKPQMTQISQKNIHRFHR